MSHGEQGPTGRARICVYCSSAEQINQSHLSLAAEVGREIGRRGHWLVSGGGSISCMGEVARAARAAGGYTVGVMPRYLVDFEIADTAADRLLVTGSMRERKQLMDENSDAFLALPGGIGTLEELLEVWVARDLGLHSRPVVVLDPDNVFGLLRRQIDELVRREFVRPTTRDAIQWTRAVQEAIDLIEAAQPWKAPDRARPRPGGGWMSDATEVMETTANDLERTAL